MQCQTIKVVSPVSDENPLGYIVINESDLTEDHEIFGEAVETSEAPEGDNAEPKQKRKYTKRTEE